MTGLLFTSPEHRYRSKISRHKFGLRPAARRIIRQPFFLLPRYRPDQIHHASVVRCTAWAAADAPLLWHRQHIADAHDPTAGETLLAEHHGGESPVFRVLAQDGFRNADSDLALPGIGEDLKFAAAGDLRDAILLTGHVDARRPALGVDAEVPGKGVLQRQVAPGEQRSSANTIAIGVDVDVKGLQR